MPYVNGKVVNWQHKLRIKHLLSCNSGLSYADSMSRILDVMMAKPFMQDFLEDISGGEWFDFVESKPKDYEALEWGDHLLSELYDYCDWNLIWVE